MDPCTGQFLDNLAEGTAEGKTRLGEIDESDHGDAHCTLQNRVTASHLGFYYLPEV